MSEVTTGSLKTLFKFPFQGPEWQSRFIIGAALIFASMALPIPLIRWIPWVIVSGYALQILRQAVVGQAPSLPAWDDWGKLATDGLRSFAVTLVYMLPATIVFFGGMGLYFVASFAIPFLMQAADNEGIVMLGLFFMFGSMAIMFLSMFIGWVLLILGVVPLPVARAHFAARDRVAAAFNVRQWWSILRANVMGYLVAFVVTAGLGAVLYIAFILAYLSVIFCCLIPFLVAPIGFYVWLVSAALFGQTYHEGATLLAGAQGTDPLLTGEEDLS
jgi:hypothetical protein